MNPIKIDTKGLIHVRCHDLVLLRSIAFVLESQKKNYILSQKEKEIIIKGRNIKQPFFQLEENQENQEKKQWSEVDALSLLFSLSLQNKYLREKENQSFIQWNPEYIYCLDDQIYFSLCAEDVFPWLKQEKTIQIHCFFERSPDFTPPDNNNCVQDDGVIYSLGKLLQQYWKPTPYSPLFYCMQRCLQQRILLYL